MHLSLKSMKKRRLVGYKILVILVGCVQYTDVPLQQRLLTWPDWDFFLSNFLSQSPGVNVGGTSSAGRALERDIFIIYYYLLLVVSNATDNMQIRVIEGGRRGQKCSSSDIKINDNVCLGVGNIPAITISYNTY